MTTTLRKRIGLPVIHQAAPATVKASGVYHAPS
jgi:hypothetical protein